MNKEYRVLILSPTVFPSITGNATTTERWRQSLVKKGYEVQVIATRDLNATDLLDAIQRFEPDIIHAYHALHSGVFLLDPRVSEACNGLPVVVSLPGTDADLETAAHDRKDVILKICRNAQAITAQSAVIIDHLKANLPGLDDRIFYVPKAPSWIGNDTFDLRGFAGCRPGDVLFFLPAGIRPVKGNLECLRAFKKVSQISPVARIVFAGQILDADYGTLFQKELAECAAFACRIPSIAHTAMRSAYEGADIVLNTSFSEGLSNVLLEAISAGRPLLASDIPSTRWLILGDGKERPCGVLYGPDDPDDLCRKALELIDNGSPRKSMAEAARHRALTLPTPADEADALIEAYKAAQNNIEPVRREA